jgi:malate dehydrogenase
VLVVGNPANTNAWVLAEHAPGFARDNITSMIRLDHNRAASQLATQANVNVGEIERLAVWGNHSPTMYADWTNAVVGGEPCPPDRRPRLVHRHVDPAGGAARHRDHRGARRILGRVRRQCRARSYAGLAAWVGRTMGVDGPVLDRRVRYSGGADVRCATICSPGSVERVSGLRLDDFQHMMIQRSVAELVQGATRFHFSSRNSRFQR